ncbi:MAG: hypothetical protein FNP40_04480 [Dehalobacter sp. 4CP]|nr:hypothetical protein [Dehalobacter sp. 4CP]
MPFCIALTEPEAGSDASCLGTRAIKDGDHYYLNGRKSMITNWDSAQIYTVFATIDPQLRTKGITAFF